MTHTHPTAMPKPSGERASLVDALDRLLATGAALDAELALSVADVDLVYVGLKALIRSSAPDDVDLRVSPGFATHGAATNRRGGAA